MTFLDLIAQQVLSMREAYGDGLRFLLMNSFSTSDDTLAYLGKYPELGGKAELELLQNRAPKIDAEGLGAVEWSANPELEWCPPGHGDLYPALVGSGWLERLLEAGVRYAFVSNSDNLGATLDPSLLAHFAASDAPFLMEVTARTEADKKGGHLARSKSGGGLLLRESAQCPEADAGDFQDISKHRFFNTNNLWLRLDLLAKRLEECGGVLPLPVISNKKTVDPRDSSSKPVFQLETAMGAAIECFDGAQAIAVPRSRFAPVKTCDDLLALRSDAYVVTDDFRLELAPERAGRPPVVTLDKAYFKRADQLDAATKSGVPSLIGCERLEVSGPVCFEQGTVISGAVSVSRADGEPGCLPAGSYADQRVEL
jgi:UDP-N-acetylglucosamine pyrophosphorylase